MRLMITIFISGMMSVIAQAGVVKSSAEGFIVEYTAIIENDTSTVFETMTGKVGQWWSSDHSFSGDAGNMLIDAQCFCERWNTNLVRHLNTAIWLENSKVVMEGGLGPLKELGLSGTMIWTLTADDNAGTTVNWKYHVYGYSNTDLTTLATAVDGVLSEQMARFLEALEQGAKGLK